MAGRLCKESVLDGFVLAGGKSRTGACLARIAEVYHQYALTPDEYETTPLAALSSARTNNRGAVDGMNRLFTVSLRCLRKCSQEQKVN